MKPVKKRPGRSKLPWILGGITALVLCCGCAGVIVGVLVWSAPEEPQSEAARAQGGGLGEWLAVRRAALSHKLHSNPWKAPAGHEVHINQSQAMGPSARDTEILNELIGRRLPGPEALDVLPQRAWAVNLYQDPSATSVSRVTVDLDRDGNADEQWTVEGTRVRRQVSTADDGRYDQSWLWQNGLWLAR